MADSKKYYDKFQHTDFTTDASKDMLANHHSISKDLNSEKINDDFSNDNGLYYAFSAEGEDIESEKK